MEVTLDKEIDKKASIDVRGERTDDSVRRMLDALGNRRTGEFDEGGRVVRPAGFSIGYVSSRTGLSAHVIRAWERRYKAVLPQRSDSRRRIYTQADIDRLIQLKRLLDCGHSISLIAGLDHEKLAQLIGEADASGAMAEDREGLAPSCAALSADVLVGDCLQAVQMLDGAALRRNLQEGLLFFSRQGVIDKIIQPLMDHVGRRWSEGSLRIVHGHLAAAVVHAHLTGMLASGSDEIAERPLILIAAPAGQGCYLGALAVAATAQDHGWKPVFLGYNLPAEEIGAACTILDPQLIALSITCRVHDGFMHAELDRLSTLIADRCPVVVGGRSSHFYRRRIEGIGGILGATTQDLVSRLQ